MDQYILNFGTISKCHCEEVQRPKQSLVGTVPRTVRETAHLGNAPYILNNMRLPRPDKSGLVMTKGWSRIL